MSTLLIRSFRPLLAALLVAAFAARGTAGEGAGAAILLEKVAPAVICGPQSVVWHEAKNRLHTQKALMEYLLLGRVKTQGDLWST